MKLEFSRQCKKYSNIKLHENPSSESRVVACERTNITKQMVAFRNFANAPKNAGVYRDVEGTTEPCDTEGVPVHSRSFRGGSRSGSDKLLWSCSLKSSLISLIFP